MVTSVFVWTICFVSAIRNTSFVPIVTETCLHVLHNSDLHKGLVHEFGHYNYFHGRLEDSANDEVSPVAPGQSLASSERDSWFYLPTWAEETKD